MGRTSLLTKISAIVPLTVATVTLAVMSPAAAIVNGLPDGNLHPNTGEMVVPGQVYCSGVLLSPTVFATAAHCVVDGFNSGVPVTSWTVTFNSQIGSDVNNPTGQLPVVSASYNPLYDLNPTNGSMQAQSLPHLDNDMAELTFANPVSGITPAHLPAIGYVDSLATGPQNVILESVGYGADSVDAKKNLGVPNYRSFNNEFISNDSYSVAEHILKVTSKNGGVCFGDSGGPTFVGSDDTTVLSLNEGVSSGNCNGWGYATRLDTQQAYDFYSQFLH